MKLRKIFKEMQFVSGSVLASRLSEVEHWNVLLVEAGGEEDIYSDTPLLVVTQWNSEKDWNYTTVEQKNVCRGKYIFTEIVISIEKVDVDR